MTDTAISVENLSKIYRIGRKEEVHKTFVGASLAMLRKPLANLRRLRRMTSFEDQAEDILWALKDVSFEVERGEIIGIIGRNGAGKSTLLKILAHITHPSAGRVMLRGRISSLLEVGTGFHPELTGRENIYLNGTILGMSKLEIDRKFDEIVAFSGVEKFIDTPVKFYSSGMRVRLAFSVAAHLEPEILLIDEVLAVGDAEFQKKCLGKMSEVAGAGRTVLFVSHNMLAIQNLCQKVVWLNQGQMVTSGETKDIIQQYLNKVNDFIQTPLASRSDREGDGRLRFKEFAITDAHGNLLNSVESGQAINIVLDFEIKPDYVLRDVAVQISFANDMGQRLFILLTRFAGMNFKELRAGDRVQCEIPSLPLLPGTYTLDLVAKEGYDLLDHLQEGVQLDVTGGDVYGTGKLQKADGGNFIVQHSWAKLPGEHNLAAGTNEPQQSTITPQEAY